MGRIAQLDLPFLDAHLQARTCVTGADDLETCSTIDNLILRGKNGEAARRIVLHVEKRAPYFESHQHFRRGDTINAKPPSRRDRHPRAVIKIELLSSVGERSQDERFRSGGRQSSRSQYEKDHRDHGDGQSAVHGKSRPRSPRATFETGRDLLPLTRKPALGDGRREVGLDARVPHGAALRSAPSACVSCKRSATTRAASVGPVPERVMAMAWAAAPDGLNRRIDTHRSATCPLSRLTNAASPPI